MMNSTGTSVNEASPLKNHPPGGGGSGAFRDDVVPAASAPETAAVDGRNKLPSSKYKGVVPQPNGRWGAQIYEKHQRVWLGTFNDEVEAAVAYDVAAQRFRGRRAVTNFKPLCDKSDAGAAELIFLSSHSKAEIVDMLRKHTYQDELLQSLPSFRSALDLRTNGGGVLLPPASAREQLFEKAVTPSDVGKLNRLVIPKQHAEKHFPLQMGASSSTSSQGALLNFEDVHGKLWRFRYSYWNSSQSYVLTKGWSRFVKEKSLKAGDVVTFLRSVGPERQLYIDWRPNTPVVLPGRNAGGGSGAFYPCVIAPSRQTAGREVKLFGVDISRESLGSGRGGSGGSERKGEVEVLPTCSQTWERQFFGTWRR